MKKDTNLQIVYKAVDDLIPYVNNARTHSDDQVTQIASSIKEFGFNNPILLDGENGVVAGHGRLLAAKKLKLASVPCIELKHLSESQKRAYILADNRIALNSDWDEELLKVEIEELKVANFDLEVTGFSDEDFENLSRDFGHIDELFENGLETNQDGTGTKNSDLEVFAKTFLFPNEVKEKLDNFIKQWGEDAIVNEIVRVVSNGN